MGEEHPGGFADRLAAWRGDRRIAAVVCACVALAALVAWWQTGRDSAPAAGVPPPASSVPRSFSSTTRANDRLIVDVVGAVARPGIVRVAAGSRVVDAIDAAGGAKPSADLEQLNLAAPVADGTRVAVPVVGQAPVAPANETPASATTGTTASGPVNLNTATADQLEALPGIGPATAQAIVSDREAHGAFGSVDDLDRVRGIGAAKLAQLRDLVTV